MELSVFFARLFGLYMLIFAAVWILRRPQMDLNFKNILASEPLLVFAGALDILFGLIIVLVHPLWVWNWRLIITLLGYLIIIRGIVRFGFPKEMHNFAVKVLKDWYWIAFGVVVAVGVILTCLGFFA